LDENLTDAWIGKGDALLCLGLIKQAQEVYNHVLTKNRYNGPAREGMARILYLEGIYQAALASAMKALDNDQIPPANYARAHLTFANALNATDKHNDAIDQYMIAEKKASDASPLEPVIDFRELQWAKASAYLHRADHEYLNSESNRSDYLHARDCFQKMVDKNISDASAWMMQGICNLKLWQFDEAEECFNKVMDLDPTNETALRWCGNVTIERRPHVRVVNFSNGDIEIPSLSDVSRDVLSGNWEKWRNWEPPEEISAKLENLADVDAIAEISIWTVPSSQVRNIKIKTVTVYLPKNSKSYSLNEKVVIPWDAFINRPKFPPLTPSEVRDLLDYAQKVMRVELAPTVSARSSS